MPGGGHALSHPLPRSTEAAIQDDDDIGGPAADDTAVAFFATGVATAPPPARRMSAEGSPPPRGGRFVLTLPQPPAVVSGGRSVSALRRQSVGSERDEPSADPIIAGSSVRDSTPASVRSAGSPDLASLQFVSNQWGAGPAAG